MEFSDYMKDQEERARKAEQIAGVTFRACLDACGGNHAKAALLFGQQYWEERRPGRYTKTHDRLLAGQTIIHQPITDEEAEVHIRAGRWPGWYKKKCVGQKPAPIAELKDGMRHAGELFVEEVDRIATTSQSPPPSGALHQEPALAPSQTVAPPEVLKEPDFDESTLPF